MISFKKFVDTVLSKNPIKYPNIETEFGGRSKGQKYPNIETDFGKHSDTKKKPLSEDSEEPKTAIEQLGKHGFADTEPHEHNKLEETPTLKAYTNGSTLWNKTLHRLSNGDNLENIRHRGFIVDNIHHLDKSMNSASTKGNFHVFTGIRRSPTEAFGNKENYDESLIVHHPAFLSTSTSYQMAKEFALPKPTRVGKNKPRNIDAPSISNGDYKHILKIHVPEGTKAGSVDHFSANEGEQEILLHRGHNLEIHPHPTIMRDGTHVWHTKIHSHFPMDL